MKIPLVSQQLHGSSAGSFLKPTSALFSQQAKLGPLRASQKLSGSLTGNDATTKDIKEEIKDIDKIEPKDLKGFKISGYLGGALKELSNLSKRIKKLEQELEEKNTTPDQYALIQEELQSMRSEAERIVKSEPFKKALDALQSIEASLKQGTISKRALSGVASLLGDDFLNLVNSNSVSSVAEISKGVNKLTETTAAALTEPGAVEKLGALSLGLTNILASAKPPAEEAQKEESKTAVQFIEAPELNEMNFAAAGDLALSLRSYHGKDLIKAVAGGFVDNVEDISRLIIDIPDETQKEKEDEKIKHAQQEEQSAKRAGLDIEQNEIQASEVQPKVSESLKE